MKKKIYQFNFGHYKKSSDKRLQGFISKIVFYLGGHLKVTSHPAFANVYIPKFFGLLKEGKTIYEGYFSYNKSKLTGKKNYYCILSQVIKSEDWEGIESKEIDLFDKK